MTKDNQLGLSQELTKRLQADIKKERLKTKLVAGGGVVAVLAALYLLK